jgi:hypothetical protein
MIVTEIRYSVLRDWRSTFAAPQPQASQPEPQGPDLKNLL